MSTTSKALLWLAGMSLMIGMPVLAGLLICLAGLAS